MYPKASALLLGGLALLSSSDVFALPIARQLPDIRKMTDGTLTSAPTPFIRFCIANPSECAITGRAQAISLTEVRMAELRSVNTSVNKRIREKADPAGTDVWQLNTSAGDCEDFAIQKRHELALRGWPSSALSLTMVLTGAGEGHLVLTVRTDEGDVVLDNLRGDVVSWRAAGYRWLKRQSAENPRYWVKIDPSASPAVADPQVADVSGNDDRG